MNEEVRHFSLRKLSVGLASVLVGISIFGASQTVKADTAVDQTASAVTGSVQSKDTQENKNSVKSTFSNDNQADNAKNNMAQTQVESKKDQTDSLNQNPTNSQETNNSNDLDAEKDIVRTSSLQESDNQSNKTPETALQTTQNVQSFNLKQNSQKLNQKVLATNLIETNSSPTTNGGFDEATWGKLDVTKWQGSVQDGVYQLTGYTGDLSHIIVPNEADFEKAGKSTNGLQVGIDKYTIHSLRSYQDQRTIAFSKTNNQKVKSIGTDWSNTFYYSHLSKFDGSNLDVSGITNMSYMFNGNSISDLTSLANWDVSSVTDMSYMFYNNKINDLTPLTNWKTSNVTNMSGIFGGFEQGVIVDGVEVPVVGNTISDLAPLTNWDVSNVTDMSDMFSYNKISNLTSLANWNTSKVTDMSYMFNNNEISDLRPLSNWDVSNVTNMRCMLTDNKISDLTPLTNWNIGKVVNMGHMFADNKISDLTPLKNWKTSRVTNMSGMFGNSKHEFMPDRSIVFIDGNSISDLAPLTNWDVGNVTNISHMFEGNKISNLTPLTNWNTGNATNMSCMFIRNSISDLAPLTNWNISKVTDMSSMFIDNKISDLTPLKNWKTSSVTNMSSMFGGNKISDLTPLTNWDTRKVTNMGYMFAHNPNIKDIKAIANWNMSSINDWYLEGLFNGDMQLDLTDIDMQAFLKKHGMSKVLQGSAFLTNDVDFVKANTGQSLPTLTDTAKRTIVFNFPDGTSKTVTQTIYYKTLAPAQIYWPAPTGGGRIEALAIVLNPPLLAKNTPVQADPDSLTPVDPDDPNSGNHYNLNSGNHYNLKLIKIYTAKDIKASDWQLDDTHSKDNLANSITVNGQVCFKPVKIPHVNGYKAHLVRNPFNPAMFMVSFMAVPTENKPSTPVEVAPSKPSATIDNPSKPFAPVDNPNKPADDLQKHVAAKLNSNDLGWTMPTDVSNSTYTVEVPADDAIIDLSDLVIAEPVHAQTRTQVRVNKCFKLSKKHSIKHLKHRKRVSKLFSKRYASL